MSAFSAKGDKKAQASLSGAPQRLQMGINQAAHLSGQVLVRTTQGGMLASPVPSNPGGYSGVRTGQLLGSIDYEVSGSRFLRFGSRGAFSPRGFDYAIAQHEGTSRMAARPYLTNAVTEAGPEVTRLLGEVVFRKLVGGA